MGLTFGEPEPSRLFRFGAVGDNSSEFLSTLLLSLHDFIVAWPRVPHSLGFPCGLSPGEQGPGGVPGLAGAAEDARGYICCAWWARGDTGKVLGVDLRDADPRACVILRPVLSVTWTRLWDGAGVPRLPVGASVLMASCRKSQALLVG